MDSNESTSLVIAENLFQEFFNPYTSNVRKHEIEAQLSAIKTAPNLGKLCLYFITHTSSHYVTMFALQTLESVINQQWSKIGWTQQEEIKSVLQENLISKNSNAPNYIRNKYAKLLVDIAKIDWPLRYPNFFDSMLQLLKSDDWDQLIGLILLKTICQEFMGINAIFESVSRKKDVTRLVNQYIPIVFELLTSILENVGTKSKLTANTTPPPSPTHQFPFQAPQMKIFTANLRRNVKDLGQEAFETLQLLFTWVPLELVPRKLIKAMFFFTNLSTYSRDDDDLSVYAISTVNEIFYRKSSFASSEAFYKEIYNHVVELLQNVTSSLNYRIDNIDEAFIEKLCELLILIIEQHLCRFENNPSFSSLQFLSMFFQFTMHLSSISCFLRCLSVWSVFFKQIKPINAQKYSEVFLGLASALIKKIQFNYNFSQIVDINAFDIERDGKTEWQHFLHVAVDIISRAAQFAPLEIFNQIVNSWNIYNTEYSELEGYLEMNYNGSSNAETEKLAYTLRDFSTLTFTLASLAHHFYISEKEETHLRATPIIYPLIENTLKSASSYRKLKPGLIRFNNHKLSDAFEVLHTELLTSLKTWLKWLEAHNQQCGNAEIVLKIVLPILSDGDKVSVQLSLSAAWLFLELAKGSSNLCPLRHGLIAEFIHKVPVLKFSSPQVTNAINFGVCEILLRHIKSLDSETLQKYKLMINMFFNELTRDFCELTPDSAEAKIRMSVIYTMPALADLIEYCRSYPLGAKKELTSAIKPTLDHALLLFPVYEKYVETYYLFSKFFVAVLKNLQSQIGVEFTRNALMAFFQVAVSEQQSHNFAGVQQLLEILSVVVKESTNKLFLPDILQLCMDSIYPLLLPQVNENPDIFVTFLELLYNILNIHWLYFYNSQVLMGFSPGGNEDEVGPDLPKRPEQLLAILKVFGDALLVDDINIFKQSLISLQDLNHNKKLYNKGLFRTQFLPEMLRVLLNTLLYKRQGLCNDDILFAVYNLAEVDFQAFFNTFLPHYIQNLDGVTVTDYQILVGHFNISNDQDVPSFMQHLQDFASDFQHIKLCNNT